MRRLSLVAAAIALCLAVPTFGAGAAVAATTVPPPKANLTPGLLVVLPPTGDTGSGLTSWSDAARSGALPKVRLFVSIATDGLGPTDAANRVSALRAEATAAGYLGGPERTIVVGLGDAGQGALGASAGLGGVALLGSNPSGVDAATVPVLRIAAELDRSVSLGRLARSMAAPDPARPVLVRRGATAADLETAATGTIAGHWAARLVGDRPNPLGHDLKAEAALTNLLTGAVAAEAGTACSDLQAHTADLATKLVKRLAITNRADPELMSPTPEGTAGGDLGGFLYDKAELTDHGRTASVVTNSFTQGADVAPVGPTGAQELMCKTKSRSAIAQALLDDFEAVDDSPPTCARYTARQLERVRQTVSAAAWARFGGLEILPDDPKRAGPEWVFAPLVLRPSLTLPGGWAVQSPSLVTELSDTELDPTFAGNHYCKVLSPLRLLELVLDGA